MKKQMGFTLAEVLITLGIIGVVAAITLPILIQNYRKHAYVNQLKKSVTILEQGFQKMLADNEVDSLDGTDVFGSIKNTNCNAMNGVSQVNCNDMIQNAKKYFNIVKVDSAKNLNDYKYKSLNYNDGLKYPDAKANSAIWVLSDGSYLTRYDWRNVPKIEYSNCDVIRSKGGKMCGWIGKITVDVNGGKQPNVEGRDIFNFFISDKGHLYSFWSRDAVIMQNGNDNNVWYKNTAGCGKKGESITKYQTYGSGCAARIIDSGWVMDY